MAKAAIAKRLADGQDDFVAGADSFSDPTEITNRRFMWGFNVVTEGGRVRTRPPFKVMLRLGCGKPQGFTMFTPTNGLPTMYFAISGRVYYSPFPFAEVRILENIQFDPYVDHIVFKEALVAVDDFGAAITPYAVLMMQDGKNRAAYTDGFTNSHIDPTPDGFYNPASKGGQGTKIGLWMEWIGQRLWVASRRQVFASDIYNPLKFTENQYLASGGSFQAMDGAVITGLKKTADNKQLLVFTAGNTTSIFASNTNRSSWSSTPDFVSLWFPGVGCVGGKAILVHNGEIHWQSFEGYRMYNQVGSTIRSSRNAIASHEMKKSFNLISPMTWRACGGSFGPYAMMSVPSSDSLNHHTWVLDTSSSDLLTAMLPYSWQGVWTGVRPVEWATVDIDGKKRCFFLSADYDGFVRIWEAFADGKDDEGGPIQCYMDGRGHKFGDGQNLSFKRYSHGEVHMDAVRGANDVDTFIRDEYGCFEDTGSFRVCTDDCMTLGADPVCLTPPKKRDPQSRYRILKEMSGLECAPKSEPYGALSGTYFVPRFKWQGHMALGKYLMWADEVEEKTIGECPESDEECELLACCDQEPDYRSINETPDYYYYGNVNDCDIQLV